MIISSGRPVFMLLLFVCLFVFRRRRAEVNAVLLWYKGSNTYWKCECARILQLLPLRSAGNARIWTFFLFLKKHTPLPFLRACWVGFCKASILNDYNRWDKVEVLRRCATGTFRSFTSCLAEVIGSYVTCNNKPPTEHAVPSRVESVGFSGSAHACDAKTHAFPKVDVNTSLRQWPLLLRCKSFKIRDSNFKSVKSRLTHTGQNSQW